MSRSPVQELQELVWQLRRQYPEGSTTFGPCMNDGCEIMARGSGPCWKCIVKKLGKLANPELAEALHDAIAKQRGILSEIYDCLPEDLSDYEC